MISSNAYCAVVIPCRDEELSIGAIVKEALKHADCVYVCNDTSVDNTAEVAREAGAIVINVPPTRRGLSAVYSTGLLAALHDNVDFIIEMDAGGSHDPTEIPRFIRMAKHTNVDIVFGERLYRGSYLGSRKRYWLSKLGTWLFNFCHRSKFKDATSGFIGYTRGALLHTHQHSFKAEGHYYQSEVRARALASKLSYIEIPIEYRNSSSHLNQDSILEALQLCLSDLYNRFSYQR